MINFDNKKPLTIICASGLTGLGKSTWLNNLAFCMDSRINHDIFETSSGIITKTLGMWVYPYPLFLEKNDFEKKNQILLIDMEGYGSIKSED